MIIDLGKRKLNSVKTIRHECKELRRNPNDQSEVTWYCAECDEIIYIQSRGEMKRVQRLTNQNININHHGGIIKIGYEII